MKKFLSLCLLYAASCGISSAQVKCLKEILSESGMFYTSYGYDSKNRVDSIFMEMPNDDYSSYRLLEYDEKGNNTIQKRYQKSQDLSDYLYTDYVTYTYDEDGKITSRRNYNLDIYGGTNEFKLGGIFFYFYDKNNNLIKRQLFWDEEKTRLAETLEYTYDSEGRLEMGQRTTIQFDKSLIDYKEEYSYDGFDRLEGITYYSIDYNTGKLAKERYRKYNFDENDNVTSIVEMLIDNTIMESHEYSYDTNMNKDNTVYPLNNEDEKELFTIPNNAIVKDMAFMRDLRAGELVLADIDTWVYEDSDVAGIYDVRVEDNSPFVMNISKERIILGNMKDGTQYRIYNDCGSMINKGRYNGSVNISNLNKGVYVIVTGESCFKFSK